MDRNVSLLNIDPSDLRLPFTQDLSECFEITSSMFIVAAETSKMRSDRVGVKPCVFLLDPVSAVDIDTSGDFDLAQSLWERGVRRGACLGCVLPE